MFSSDSIEPQPTSEKQLTQNPHPKNIKAWDLEQFILEYEVIHTQSIENCEKQLIEISNQATNEIGLINAKKDLQKTVNKELIEFHWCFYYLMRSVDIQLEADATTIQDKAKIFFAEMKKLWILSRALDQASKDKSYFSYLRSRYIETSQRIFGRNLEILAEPLDRQLKFSSPQEKEPEVFDEDQEQD